MDKHIETPQITVEYYMRSSAIVGNNKKEV